jgi:hypothetical protein
VRRFTYEALEAVATARLIYVDTGRVEMNMQRGLRHVCCCGCRVDNDSYEAAEKQFQQNNTKASYWILQVM